MSEIESDVDASIQIEIFDALSSSYKTEGNGENIFKKMLRPGTISEVAIYASIFSLFLFFIALIVKAKIASLIFILVLVFSLLVVEVSFVIQSIKDTVWKDRKNLLLSNFRKNIIVNQRRIVMLRSYPKSSRIVLATRLRSLLEVEDSRLNLLVGVSRKLGMFPALAALYGAYISVFPEDIGVAFDSSSAIAEQLIAKLGIFSMAAIVGIYIGACASEAALVRVKSMVTCLDAANEAEIET